jgi:HemY protein
MRWLLYLFGALLAAVTLGTIAARDPGRVVLVWGGWTVETSAVVFAAAALVAIVVLRFCARIVRGLLRLPELLRRWRGDRRALQAEELLARGLREMLAGDWRAAERDFKRWAARGCDPMLGYLHAARAAAAQGAERRRDHWLRLAREAGRDRTAFLAARAALLPELPEAAAELERLAASGAQVALPPHVRRARLESALERRAWDAARAEVESLVDAGAMDAAAAAAARRRIAAGILDDAGGEESLRAAWAALPRDLQRDPGVLVRYVQARLRYGAAADCERAISDVLARHWNAELVLVYGMVRGEKPERQLRVAEGWLKRHGPGAELLLTLGRLALRAGHGERGRAWLEESLRHAPSAAACRELGRWFEEQGDAAQALRYYRQGLASPP